MSVRKQINGPWILCFKSDCKQETALEKRLNGFEKNKDELLLVVTHIEGDADAIGSFGNQKAVKQFTL